MTSKPKTAARHSLRDRLWTSLETALRDLKKAGLPQVGEDYQLREVRPKQWRLAPLGGDETSGLFDVAETPEPEPKVVKLPERREPRVARGIKPSPQRKAPAREAKSVLTDPARKAPAAKAVTKAPRKAPTPPAAAVEEPPTPAAPVVPVDPLGGVTSGTVLFIVKGMPGSGNAFQWALELIGRLGTGYAIEIAVPTEHTVLGTVDWETRLAHKQSHREARAEASPRKGPVGRRNPDSKNARATALLIRPEGATAAEIAKATGWNVGQRHINRLSQLSKRPIIDIGEKHWRLGEID